jgi:hypothetical protein
MSDTEPLPNRATTLSPVRGHGFAVGTYHQKDLAAGGRQDCIASATPGRQKGEISRMDSASAWHFEPILVDFETLDLRIERSRRQT